MVKIVIINLFYIYQYKVSCIVRYTGTLVLVHQNRPYNPVTCLYLSLNSCRYALMQLHVKNLNFGWSEALLLEGVNVQLSSGDLIQLCGDNGSGKTTFLQLLSGMIPHFQHGKRLSGDIYLDGISLFDNSPQAFFPNIAFIPANFLDLYFIGECIKEDISIIQSVLQIDKIDMTTRINTYQESFPEISELWQMPYNRMSHHQKVIALTLIYYAQYAKLYAFDEHILSPDIAPRWLQFYKYLIQEQCIVVTVTHITQLDGAIQWSISNNRLLC